MTSDESFVPSARTFAALIVVPSIQLTMIDSRSSMTMSTLPMALPSSTWTGLPNDFPPSCEKITFTFDLPSDTVYHAMARKFPLATMRGPLTGHPAIFQLS